MPRSTAASIVAKARLDDERNSSRKRNQTTSSASSVPPARKDAASNRRARGAIWGPPRPEEGGRGTAGASTFAKSVVLDRASADAAARTLRLAAARPAPRTPKSGRRTVSPESAPATAPIVFHP